MSKDANAEAFDKLVQEAMKKKREVKVKNFKFEIGDRVKIDYEKVYSTYTDLARHMKLSNWEYEREPTIRTGRVKARSQHDFEHNAGPNVYGVEIMFKDFLVEEKGLAAVPISVEKSVKKSANKSNSGITHSKSKPSKREMASWQLWVWALIFVALLAGTYLLT